MTHPLPNLFILGTPRSGTTSVAKWLGRHPDVAGGELKEPMYHASDLPSPLSITDFERYSNLWADSGDAPIRLEASVWYLYSKHAASSIARLSPDARFIVHLRNPVDLLASLHAHHVFLGFEDEQDFRAAVFSERQPDTAEFRRSTDYLEVARLGGQLLRFHEHFPQDRFTFVDFGALSTDPEATYMSLLDDLGLDRVSLSTYPHMNPGRRQRMPGANQRFADTRSVAGRGIGKVVRKLNTTVGRRPVDPEARRRILERLAPDIDDLAGVIDRDLSGWKGS